MLLRSLLFAPANRPDLVAKFPRVPADVFSPDLEDGTPPAARPEARAALAGTVAAARGERTDAKVFVRINPASTPDCELDVAALRGSGADGIVLAKAESAADLAALAGTGLPVIAGIESARGVAEAVAIARGPGVVALYFGGEDFTADMGGRRTKDGYEMLFARSQVLLAARVAGVKALDTVMIDIRDDEGFRRDAIVGRNLGFDGKMCLLPRQVTLAHEVFAPSAAEIDTARRLVAAYEEAVARGAGTIDFEGRMVDPPVLKAAQAIMRAAGSA